MTSFLPDSGIRPSIGVVSRLIGHKGRAFDIKVAPSDANTILSASEDGEAKMWDLNKKSAVHTFIHNVKAEALRCNFIRDKICVAGSDGDVSIWNEPENTNTRSTVPLHRLHTGSIEDQVYICEPCPDRKSNLLVGAENKLMLWDLTQPTCPAFSWEIEALPDREGEVFGGNRNVHQSTFVFDAKWSPSEQSTLAVAASDATVRLLDVRESSQEQGLVLDFHRDDGVKLGHATSVSWSGDGGLLSVSFGSGCVALFDIRQDAECLGIYQLHRRPCYGASLITYQDNACVLSFSSDATVKLRSTSSFSSLSQSPESVVIECEMDELSEVLACAYQQETGRVICGGSSTGKSFLGIPLLVIDPSAYMRVKYSVNEEES